MLPWKSASKGSPSQTKDRRDLTGIIVAETPTTLTLRAKSAGPDHSARRLEGTHRLGVSPMPEGLESAFTPQQLADLIACVNGGR
jgi:hypothetical protein